MDIIERLAKAFAEAEVSKPAAMEIFKHLPEELYEEMAEYLENNQETDDVHAVIQLIEMRKKHHLMPKSYYEEEDDN